MLNQAESFMGEMQSFGRMASFANNLSKIAEGPNGQGPGDAAAGTNMPSKGPPPPEAYHDLVDKLEKVVVKAQ
eukprot:2364594-Karenia_brevis.AAC.1